MNSFYGGKQGRTYHIVQRYDSVQQMLNAFSQGGAYTKVNYGQYVIIDTIRKSDDQNGLLYRRGFNYTQEQGVKPSKTDSKYLDDQNHFREEEWLVDWKNYIYNPGSGAIYVGQIVGPRGETPQIELIPWSEMSQQSAWNSVTGSFSLGKVDDENFNDDIRVAYITLRDETENVVGAKIAFDIPVTIFQTEVVNSSPYSVAGVQESPSSTAHPFYYKWDFTIPDGKHGQDINSLEIKYGSEISGVSVASTAQYLTYTTINYDTSPATTVSNQGVWPYRVIDEITGNQQTLTTLYTWSTSTQPQVGQLYPITVSGQSTPVANMYYCCIQSGTVGSSAFSPSSTPSIGQIVSSNQSIWRVVSIPDKVISSLKISYTAGEPDTIPIRNLNYITIDTNGKVYAYYSNSDTGTYLATINYILDVQKYGHSMLVLFSDPDIRNNLPSGKYVSLPWIDPVSGKQYSNLRWYNIGTIDVQYPVAGNYTYAEIKGDNLYPDSRGSSIDISNGFTDPDRQGWLITATDDMGNVNVLAFDATNTPSSTTHQLNYYNPSSTAWTPSSTTYNFNSRWYVISTITEGSIKTDLFVQVASPSSSSLVTNLKEGGLWFVLYGGHD